MATIRYLPDQAGRAELVGGIEAAGYDVRSPRRTPNRRAPTPSPRPRTRTSPSAPARAGRSCEALVSIGVALGIMVAMFWPQTAISLETLNWLALIPATFVQVWAGGRFYRPPGGRFAMGRRTWTRSSRSARRLPGATRSV